MNLEVKSHKKGMLSLLIFLFSSVFLIQEVYSTIINTATTSPFYPSQRAICRDSNNYIHVAWLYNSTAVKYANSTDNGASFTNKILYNGATVYAVGISCDSNNVVVSFVNYTTGYNLVIMKSTDNGANFQTKLVKTVYGSQHSTEIRGNRIYAVYRSSGGDVNISVSTDGGDTWQTPVIVFDGWSQYGEDGCLDTMSYGIDGITMSVDGTGTASDKVFIAATKTFADEYFVTRKCYGPSYTYGLDFANSTGGTSFSNTTILSLGGYVAYLPSITHDTSNSNNIYVSYYSSNNIIYFSNSTNGGAAWTTPYQISPGTVAQTYASTTLNVTTNNPVVFWERSNGTATMDNIVYRNYNGTGWDDYVNVTTDFLSHRYVNTKWNHAGNCIEFVWRNGTASPYNIIYEHIGSCTTSGVDSTPPTYSLNSTNSTLAGTPVSHNLFWQDNVGLNYAIFSFDNCTGSLQNITNMSLSGPSAWSNFTVVINSTVGCTIRWCVYANDTSNNWNTSCSSPFTYITSSLSSTLQLNATKVWWNDSVLASGYMTRNNQPANGTLNLFIGGQAYCSNVQVINGIWNCTFYAPIEIKNHTIAINYTDDLGNSGSNTTTLSVSPFYGKTPTRGFISILEQYVMIQDLNGKIKRVKLSLAVWR